MNYKYIQLEIDDLYKQISKKHLDRLKATIFTRPCDMFYHFHHYYIHKKNMRINDNNDLEVDVFCTDYAGTVYHTEVCDPRISANELIKRIISEINDRLAHEESKIQHEVKEQEKEGGSHRRSRLEWLLDIGAAGPYDSKCVFHDSECIISFKNCDIPGAIVHSITVPIEISREELSYRMNEIVDERQREERKAKLIPRLVMYHAAGLPSFTNFVSTLSEQDYLIAKDWLQHFYGDCPFQMAWLRIEEERRKRNKSNAEEKAKEHKAEIYYHMKNAWASPYLEPMVDYVSSLGEVDYEIALTWQPEGWVRCFPEEAPICMGLIEERRNSKKNNRIRIDKPVLYNPFCVEAKPTYKFIDGLYGDDIYLSIWAITHGFTSTEMLKNENYRNITNLAHTEYTRIKGLIKKNGGKHNQLYHDGLYYKLNSKEGSLLIMKNKPEDWNECS